MTNHLMTKKFSRLATAQDMGHPARTGQCAAAFPIFKIMKRLTRDNLIYLAIGIGIASFLVWQDFYAENHHGRGIIHISKFEFRTISSLFIVGYYLALQLRKLKATITEILGCLLVSSLLLLAVAFEFRDYMTNLPGIAYVGVVVLEAFFIFSFAKILISQFGSRSADKDA